MENFIYFTSVFLNNGIWYYSRKDSREEYNMKNKLILLLICFVLIGIGTACGNEAKNKPDQMSASNHDMKTLAIKEKPPAERKKTISLAAIGDILIHDRVYNVAKTKEGYDFKPFLKKVKPTLQAADITFANQETMIGGEEIGLSSYPSFNSPYEVGDALKDAGVQIVSMANNHTLDRGEMAIQNAIHHWENIDMKYVGSYKDDLDRSELRVIETDAGISVAFLAYTYGTNGIPVPEGKDFLVNLIDEDKIASEIELVKEQADVVVVSYHFGNEYERMPSEEQKYLVQLAADHGAHLVIGHHPHVLQPIEWIEGKNGNHMLAVYSLGNFLSGQDGLYKQIGGIFECEISKTFGENERIEIHSPKFMPTYVPYGEWIVTPMHELTDDELPNADTHYKEIKQHLSQYVPELEFKEEQ